MQFRNVLCSEYDSLIKAILNDVEDTFCDDLALGQMTPQSVFGMQQQVG